ncbi:MAG: OmpA family protein [Sphingobacteriia bacterium]|nr:OmpA family protein [Sphingobacteriia bacterium]
MKSKKIIISVFGCLMLFVSSTFAQTNTMYFMDELPGRHVMNPAFFPNTKVYVDFVVFPSFYISGGNNSFTLKDFVYRENKNSGLVTPFNPDRIDKFYNRIKSTTSLDMEFGLDVVSFGFVLKEKNFLTFDWSLKGNVQGSIPRDLFKLAAYGTPLEDEVNSFNFKNLGINASLYSDLGFGYMRRINEKWTVGGKLKFYVGYANINTKINQLTLDASGDSWDVKADAVLRGALPVNYQLDSKGNVDFKSFSLASTDDIVSLIYKPAGFGMGIDLGGTFEPIKNLVISAAITDLGFINWHRNLVSQSFSGESQFTGVTYHPGDSIDFKKLGEDFINAFGTEGGSGNSYNEMVMMNANVGIEYGILNNKISFGLLSRTKVKGTVATEEVTLAANFRPAEWFKTSLSYSFVNGRWNNLGLGLNLRVGPINTFLIADYIPLNWALIDKGDGSGNTMSVPYNTQRVNLQMGMCLNIGRYSSDWDQDGIRNKKDKCPDTDIKYLTSLCQGWDKKQLVDSVGCDRDEDKDGVHNCFDQCPHTPLGVQVDSVGCPIDSDKDGVPDYLDKCPETPIGVLVDSIGCPLDDDKDGVPNYIDKCPNTPLEVPVDSVGCPFDTDGDGVLDYLDQCPGTPMEAYGLIDSVGCPIDTDGDGVPDYLDKCPNTPKEAYQSIDEHGCPKDTDGDGVPDYLDKCPTSAGPASNYGCPELKKEVKNLFKKAMQGIQFETGKDVIKKVSYPILNQIADVMKENPTYHLAISGHTDDVGNDEYNQTLSDKRAASVRRYLINQGIDENRMTSHGYGETRPIADNKTKQGRALNRRVEFEVSFETVTYEKVINEELQDVLKPAEKAVNPADSTLTK